MAENTHDPLLGTPVLGGYVITGVLGAGGMGSVYVAEHQRIHKKVAIKVLHPHMTSNRDIVQRFLAEARAASALDHPNIIEVVDAATLDDGRDYIALEYLHGDALDDYLRARKQLELRPALHILAQTCCGLEAAHHLGIVHRDLKPANLFISPTELDPLRTKILDFGIAKLTDTVMAGGIETGTNAVAGTPGYMAPEQARGMRDVDHRADIYALGAVAYRMMSGSLPYDGQSLGEIIYQQLAAPPPSIATRRADLPPGWVHAIMSSLGNEPGMRPASARHLALELAAATPGGIDIVRAAAPLLFTDSWIERNHALVGRLPEKPAIALAAPGGTATQRPAPVALAHAVTATPATTLSSAVGHVSLAPAPRRPWLLLGAGGAAIAAVVAIVAIASVTGSGGSQADVADAGVMAAAVPPLAIDGGEVIAAAPRHMDASSIDAARVAPDRVTIRLAIKPRDATVELDGVVVSGPLKLPRDSEHQLVVRRRGYETETRDLRASTPGTVRVTLRRDRKAAPTISDKKPGDDTSVPPKGPISTSLDDASKPAGPTSDKL